MGLFGKRRDKSQGPSEAPPEWAGFFGSAERYERFEAAVRAHFKSRGQKVMISDGVVVLPSAPSSNRYGLMNLGQLCAQADEAQWPELIRGHFERMERANAAGDTILDADFDAIAPMLAVRLYEPEHISEILDKTVTREDIPGLRTALCIDLPDTIQTVTTEQAEKWGRAEGELFDIAIERLAALIDTETQEVEIDPDTKITAFVGDSFFNASMLLVPERLQPVIGKHGAFVSAPTRHMVLAVPINGADAIRTVAHLMHMTSTFEARGPGSVSRRVWWTDTTRWIEVPYEVTKKGVEVSPTEEFVAIMNSIAD